MFECDIMLQSVEEVGPGVWWKLVQEQVLSLSRLLAE